MKKELNLIAAGILGTVILMGCSDDNRSDATMNEQTTVTSENVQGNSVNQNNSVNVDDWPETAKKAANAMIEKYGQPAESTPSMLIWHDSGPFKRTIVYKEEVDHDFPMPHKDVLEQFINYTVPADKFDELAMFDGSVIAERTKGELSARCDKEGANILALNLSDDIVKGKRNVQEARGFYGKTMMEMMQGNQPEYLQKLQFSASGSDAGDPDKTTMDMSKVKQMKQN